MIRWQKRDSAHGGRSGDAVAQCTHDRGQLIRTWRIRQSQMQINDFQLTAPDLPSLSSTRVDLILKKQYVRKIIAGQSSKDEHIRKTEGKGLASWQTGWVMQPDEQVLNGDPAVQDAGGWRKTAKGQLRPSERVETALNAR